MIVSLAPHDRLSRALLFATLAATFAAPLGHSQGTHLWTQSRLEEFEKGTPQGVAITSDGRLVEGPGAAEIVTTPSTFVWSVAVDSHGSAFLGTASPATVLRVAKDGKTFKLFESKDLSIQVVRLGPDGLLYAATLPSGKVYKLKPDATTTQDDASAQLVFDASKAPQAKPDPKSENDKSTDAKSDTTRPESSHFIWDMTFDPQGRLYIASGGPAAIYRVDPTAPKSAPEMFFKSDEQHIRCLAWDAKGNLIAGTDGSGLIYRISSDGGPAGKGYVLFEAPRREITSLAIAPSGAIYAASVGDKSHNPLPPLPVQGQGSVTITIVQPSSLTTANTSASVPEGSEIYLLTEGQAPRKIWSTKDEVVYALAARKEGLLALTGNRGHLFKIADDGSFSDIAHVEAQQALTLAQQQNPSPDSSADLLIGTGNTGNLYLLSAQSGKHEYASDVLDAGGLSRFGRVEVEPGSSGYELWTRSGNVEQPARNEKDWGWSDWVKLNDNQIASPAGRFFQWKAVLHDGGSLGSVGINYLPINAAPVIEDLVVAPGARLNPQNLAPQPPTVQINFPSANVAAGFDGTSSQPLQALKDRTAVTVRWAAHDDNGDDLKFSLYIRGDGEKGWRLLKDDLTDHAYSFDATLIPDGGYRIKLVASDAPSHTPADALTAEKESDRFEIDTTPPIVSGLRVSGSREFQLIFDAEDAFSPIAHAEYSIDSGPWQYIEPVGIISDSRREHYDVTIPSPTPPLKPGEHLITVRAYDRHDNIGVAKITFNVPATH